MGESIRELVRQGRKREVWDRLCGFLDLGIDEFMAIQRNSLEHQLERLSRSELGAKLLGERSPRTLEEFRETVPFTTYRNYAPHLPDKNEAALPEEPYTWAHASGRSGEFDMKWVPYTRRMYELGGEAGLTCLVLSAAKEREEVVLKEGMTFPYIIAPPPFTSGILTQRVLELFPFKSFPPLKEAAQMDFQRRIQEAFKSAVSEGLDFFFGVTSILMKISESFSHVGGGGTMGKFPLRPKRSSASHGRS